MDMDSVPDIRDERSMEPDEYARTSEQIALLKRLLGDQEADIFLRYCVYGEKAAPIANELGITEQALRMRISRLKKKILKNRELFAVFAALFLLSVKGGA